MDEKNITNIKIENILPNRMQPRIVFEDESIDELAESIKKHGIINPITVRRLGNKYEIIAGERRFKASQSIGLKEIPAIVIEADDKKTAELALIENIQRKELSPIEEGMSYEKILQIGDITQAELSKQLGKKQSTIANKIRLLKLDDSVKDALLNEKISERHARSLLKLYDRNDQKRMLDRIINERLTVRQTDKEIEKIVEEKGEMIEMDKNVNLPSSSMIFDKKEEQIDEPGKAVNPSFVDVNKIEEKSEDIFTDKPIVNIEDLLKSAPKPAEKEQKSVQQESINEEPKIEEPVQKYKFFNIFPEEENDIKTESENIETENNENKKNEQPIENPNTEIPEMNFNISDIENFNSLEPETSDHQALSEISDHQELPEIKPDEIEEQAEEKENSQNELIENNQEYNFENFNPIIHNDFAGEEIKDDDVEFFEEEPTEEIQTPENVEKPKEMKDVIRIIRDCNNIIESYGYKIETEEFDLETMYQVIFKIYKK